MRLELGMKVEVVDKGKGTLISIEDPVRNLLCVKLDDGEEILVTDDFILRLNESEDK